MIQYPHVPLKAVVLRRGEGWFVEFRDKRDEATYPSAKTFPTKRGAEAFAASSMVTLSAVNPILCAKPIDPPLHHPA